MSDEEYSALIKKVFMILKLKKPKTRNMHELLRALEEASHGPIMSKTQIQINELIRDFTKAIRNNEPTASIKGILENLQSELDYSNYWD